MNIKQWATTYLTNRTTDVRMRSDAHADRTLWLLLPFLEVPGTLVVSRVNDAYVVNTTVS